jgi:hypothetical protein
LWKCLINCRTMHCIPSPLNYITRLD